MDGFGAGVVRSLVGLAFFVVLGVASTHAGGSTALVDECCLHSWSWRRRDTVFVAACFSLLRGGFCWVIQSSFFLKLSGKFRENEVTSSRLPDSPLPSRRPTLVPVRTVHWSGGSAVCGCLRFSSG